MWGRSRLLSLVGAMALSGCAEPDAGQGESPTSTGTLAPTEGTSAADTDIDTDDSTGPSSSCEEGMLPPGLHAGLELEHDGLLRTYDVYVPVGHDSMTPAPLVLNFHGFLSDPQKQSEISGFNDEADQRGVIVVYPKGLERSWNGGPCCGVAVEDEVDDVGFVRALIEELGHLACMDPARVYATGMSNGGLMSHRLACEAADVIAAVGPVAGPMGLPPEDCQPARPVPLIHFHGTGDELVPYEGSESLGFPPILEMSADWAARNGCNDASEVTLQMDDVTCQTWDGCDADASVTLCTLEGLGHCWPGYASCTFGEGSLTISASAMMLDLFEQHAL